MNPQATIVHTHMYKSWIRGNPELARDRIEQFFVDAAERGMMTTIRQDDNYVDLVAAFNEDDLAWQGV